MKPVPFHHSIAPPNKYYELGIYNIFNKYPTRYDDIMGGREKQLICLRFLFVEDKPIFVDRNCNIWQAEIPMRAFLDINVNHCVILELGTVETVIEADFGYYRTLDSVFVEDIGICE